MLPENIYQGSLSAIFDQIDKRRLTKVWVHLTSSQGVTTAQLAIAVTIAWSAATSKLLGIPKISWCTPTQNKEEEEKHPKNSSCVPSNFLHLLTPCLGHCDPMTGSLTRICRNERVSIQRYLWLEWEQRKWKAGRAWSLLLDTRAKKSSMTARVEGQINKVHTGSSGLTNMEIRGGWILCKSYVPEDITQWNIAYFMANFLKEKIKVKFI